MLAFIIPLRSKVTTKNWIQVSQLLERCLISICNQTNSNFRIIVIHNEKPKITFLDPRIIYIEVDFIPADLNSVPEKDLDKGRRIITGLLEATKLQATHTMIVDADDCISKHLVEYVNKYPNSPGWYIDKGYVWQENSQLIYYRKSHFYKWCGSGLVINRKLYDLSQYSTLQSLHSIEFDYNHKLITLNNEELARLPFPGAVYVIGHGENIYQTGFKRLHRDNYHKIYFRLKDALNYRLLTPKVRDEFNLY